MILKIQSAYVAWAHLDEKNYIVISHTVLTVVTLLAMLLFFFQGASYRVFLHNREEKMQKKNEDGQAERWKFGTSATTM